MSGSPNLTDKGTQTIGFKYQELAKSSLFNRNLAGIAPAGIYALSTTIATPANQVGSFYTALNVNPLLVMIQDNSDFTSGSSLKIFPRVETSTVALVNLLLSPDGSSTNNGEHVDITKPYVTLRFFWEDAAGRFMDFVMTTGVLDNTLADATKLWPTDIIIGKILYDADPAASGYYTLRSAAGGAPILDNTRARWSFLPTAQTRSTQLNVYTTDPASSQVAITGGLVNTGHGNFIIAGGLISHTFTATPAASGSAGRNDLIYLDVDGTVKVLEGTASNAPATPAVSPLYNNKKVIAEIRRAGGRSTIEGPEIVMVLDSRTGGLLQGIGSTLDADKWDGIESQFAQVPRGTAAESSDVYTILDTAVQSGEWDFPIGCTNTPESGSSTKRWTISLTLQQNSTTGSITGYAMAMDPTTRAMWYNTVVASAWGAWKPIIVQETVDARPLPEWNSTATYAVNTSVIWSGRVWISLENANVGNNPLTTPYWQQLSVSVYSSAITYPIGIVVQYANALYQSLYSPNDNNQPDISPSNWAKISINPWSMALTFNANDICFYQGSLYKSSANTNLSHAPLTSPTWWTLVTGAGGGGGVNFIANSLHNADTSSWAEAPSPIGIYTFTWATDVNLFGGGGLLTVFNGSVKTSHSYIEGNLNTIQPSQLGQSWKISLAYELDGSANFGPTDLEIGLYDVTNDVFISAGFIPTTLIGQVLNTSFFVYPTTSTSYRLRIRAAVGSNTQGYLRIADVSVAPQVMMSVPAVGSDSTLSFTANPTNQTTVTKVLRVGNYAKVHTQTVFSGIPAAFSGFNLGIDTIHAIDIALLNGGIGDSSPVGTFLLSRPGVGQWEGQAIVKTAAIVACGPLTGTSGQVQALTQVYPTTIQTGDIIEADFMIPIASWSSSLVVSAEGIEYASNDGSAGTAANTTYTTGQKYGPDGSSIVAVNSATGGATVTQYAVDFVRNVLPTDEIVIQVSFNGRAWINVEAFAFATAIIGGWSYGLRWGPDPSNPYRIMVQFGNGGAFSIGGYQSAGADWSGQSFYRWRAVKRSGGSLAEVPSLIYARVSSAVVVANLASPALISFSVLEEDTHNAVVLGTPFKFTAPVSGRYQFNVEVSIVASASTTSTFVIALSKNGISQFLVVRRDIADIWISNASWSVNGQRTLKLNAGDYISVVVSASANLSVQADVNSYCEVVRLGN